MPLNNGDSSSAGVYTGVRDNAVRVKAITTSVGAIVGPAKRGPIGVPTLVLDNADFSFKFGESDPKLTFMHLCAKAFLKRSNQLYVVRVAKNPLYGALRISTVSNFSQAMTENSGYASPEDIPFTSDDIFVVYGANPGAWNNDLRVLVYPNTDDITGQTFVLNVFEGSSTVPVEAYIGTLFDSINGYGVQQNIVDQLESKNSRVRIAINYDHPELANGVPGNPINAVTSGSLTRGNDGDPIDPIDDIIEGWSLFDNPEELRVNLLINAGYTSPEVQLHMLEIAEIQENCFCILDTPSDLQEVEQNLVNFRRNTLAISTSYGALYAPDVQVRDTDAGVTLFIPPSGHVAGVFAYSDYVMGASHFAPAGLRRGVLRDVLSLRKNYKKGARDMLDDNNINVIRNIAQQGIVVFGADTLQAYDSPLKNINVRRLISGILVALGDTLEIGVFEQNDTQLRLELVSIGKDFLEPVKKNRGIDWYEIICDESNNPNELVASGDLIYDVYLHAIPYTKRIHLNVVVPKTGGLKYAVSLV